MTAEEVLLAAERAAGLCAETDREALYEITNEVLLAADQPSRYFYALKAIDRLNDLYPEVGEMDGVPQNPVYHPEGDVFVHTMLVLDRAAELRSSAQEPLSYMYAALLHDVGKCDATEIQEDGRITAYGHEVLGNERVRRQLKRLTDDEMMIATVLSHVQLHMRPNMLYRAHSKKKKTRAMYDLSMCPEDLILLSRADASGKLDAPYDENAEKWLRERLDDYRYLAAMPMVAEADLKAIGMPENTDFEPVLRRTRQLHFSGLNRNRVLRQIMQEIMQSVI